MPGLTMCASQECPTAKDCYRHPDSGTKPSDRQSWAYFGAHGCEYYVPAKWEPDQNPIK